MKSIKGRDLGLYLRSLGFSERTESTGHRVFRRQDHDATIVLPAERRLRRGELAMVRRTLTERGVASAGQFDEWLSEQGIDPEEIGLRSAYPRTSDFAMAYESGDLVPLSRRRNICFDDVLTILMGLASFNAAFLLHREGTVRPYGRSDSLTIYGRLPNRPLALVFYPRDVFDVLARDAWPESLALRISTEHGDDVSRNAELYALSAHLELRLLRAVFIDYSTRTGLDQLDPTSVDIERRGLIAFARLVRNAFVHDGRIATEVVKDEAMWRGTRYGIRDIGRSIIGTDIGPAELILLMIDLDGVRASAVQRG